jgi:hypothetical protein
MYWLCCCVSVWFDKLFSLWILCEMWFCWRVLRKFIKFPQEHCSKHNELFKIVSPDHFQTRNLLENAMCLLKKNYMKYGLGQNIHHRNLWDTLRKAPESWNYQQQSFLNFSCTRLLVHASQPWLISATCFCSPWLKLPHVSSQNNEFRWSTLNNTKWI